MKVLDPQIADLERVVLTGTEVMDPVEFTSSASARSMSDLHFELALWARGLESFCTSGRYAFRAESENLDKQDLRNEFRVTRAVLLKCGELIEQLSRIAKGEPREDILDFRRSIRALIICSGALSRTRSLNFAEWNSWCEIVSERLAGCPLNAAFDSEFEESGFAFLQHLADPVAGLPDLSTADRDDLRITLSKLGGILRALEVVREMLASDSPLKPALAIFAFVYETVNELVFEIGERLALRDDETSEVFGMLDAAAYTLAIESRKVYTHELASVMGTRSASLMFSRTEAAFGLLNDNIRQLVAGFAKLAEPESEAADLFPEFAEKLQQSIDLRRALWTILNAVRAAEAAPSDDQLEKLRPLLDSFLGKQLNFLFYKDHETFERFCEEITISDGGPDVRPLLHRFSAYVETLFNQVGMRVVLANHPFTAE